VPPNLNTFSPKSFSKRNRREHFSNFSKGLKIGVNIRGEKFDPTFGDHVYTPDTLTKARAFIAHRFPELKNAPLAEAGFVHMKILRMEILFLIWFQKQKMHLSWEVDPVMDLNTVRPWVISCTGTLMEEKNPSLFLLNSERNSTTWKPVLFSTRTKLPHSGLLLCD
jgi:hypothetical protein